jgi:Xaa-Pro aminopeptidase
VNSVMLDAQASATRAQRLASGLEPLELDALLVDAPVDVRYLTGFTGSNGLALIRAPGRGEHNFLTDFRYTIQSAEEVTGPFVIETVTGELRDAVPDLLAGEGGRLGFDEGKMTVQAHRALEQALGERWSLAPCAGLIERLRLVKEASEVARIASACELADAALTRVLEGGLAGRTEREVAFALEVSMRELGAEALSFPSIVASGEHGALPHAQPRDVTIGPNLLVTIDWGARHEGYCSDCTRTYATGEALPELAREVYEVVRSAQLAGVEAVTAGPTGRELDAVAREVIERAGYGEQFGHGLGHGVGLEVHEGPRLSRTAGDDPIAAGTVVTVEPGVYLPDALGVRIEDLLVVRSDGSETLTGLPKALTVVG